MRLGTSAYELINRGDLKGAEDQVSQLKEHTAAARSASTDPLWRIAGIVPWAGPNFMAVTDAAVATDISVNAVAPLLDSTGTFSPTLFTPKEGAVDLAALQEAFPKLSRASATVSSANNSISAINTDELLPQLAAPLGKASDVMKSLTDVLTEASNAAQILPPMLGSEGPRNYLVLVQNNAESRASGGIPGALVVLTADNGMLQLTDHGSASDIGRIHPALKVDEEQESIYTTRLGAYMQNVNLTPDFPTAASSARKIWEKANPGSSVDGVLSVDPVALAYLLEATGPIKLDQLESFPADLGSLPTTLTNENVVTTLLSDVYNEIEEPAVQDAYFGALAGEVFSGMTEGRVDASALVRALQKGTAEGRLLVWSTEQDQQSVIANSPLGGVIKGTPDSPEIGVYFNDGTGAKMDYYVRRQVELEKRCQPDGYYRYAVQVTMTNGAPPDAGKTLPDYVTGAGAFGVKPGTVQTNVYAYGPTEWYLDSAARDGKAAPFGSYKHDGRPVGAATVSLAPGESTTVEFEFSTPYETDEPALAVTPGVQPTSDVVQASTVNKDCS
ncbi:DUF4012 domain-containing protein [Arthrobacter mangrovi]|uniref:DUF4012 domain-containing protein n=1 Tax=Arthrobacter mangrovi TaxID=2966350 RepID=A0ABQ5MWD4_9MICC|nr:DUF4012 domain-containing protein [Arthrobacter mangrovi]GLB68292.1 hypothetical protein AHIS1636_27340 [Arthrobacter mangrovi]